MIDFRSHPTDSKIRQRIEKRGSRLNVEKVFGDAMVYQALEEFVKAPAGTLVGGSSAGKNGESRVDRVSTMLFERFVRREVLKPLYVVQGHV